MVKFCDIHNLSPEASNCVKCCLVTRTVGKALLPEVIRLVKAKASSSSDIPSAAERYTARLDEMTQTPTFSESDLSLAVLLFGKGKMVPSSMFEELTREYLFLPSSQNEALNKLVQLDKMFQKFKQDKNFTNTFFLN